jgi:uncharacterized protein YjbI with pentapeptide repeats
MRQGVLGGAFIVGSSLAIIVVAMAQRKDTNPAEPEASSKRPPWWGVAFAGLALVGMGAVIVYGYLDMPGSGLIGVANKRFWDYLELLIVPAALAIGVYWLNRRQTDREHKAAAEREREREAAEEAQRDRELEGENQQAQDAALQAYLDQMSQLLTDKERPLRRAQPGDSLSSVARARTLTVLEQLSPSRKVGAQRKGNVLQFLHESALVQTKAKTERPVISLNGANLRNTNLLSANLRGASLQGAFLDNAKLPNADLRCANLSNAFLTHASLHGANLSNTNLTNAYMSNAYMRGTDLSCAVLIHTVLHRANLHRANLRRANLVRG